MNKFIYKTYDDKKRSALFGEQMMLYTLLQGKVDFDFTGDLDGIRGAIINIRAFDNEKYAEEINEDISKLDWCIIIFTGNEHGTKLHTKIKHPNCKIWLQTPQIGNVADYFIGFGWPTDEILKFSNQSESNTRIYDFSFSGNVNNYYRRNCVDALGKLEHSVSNTTGGFGMGLPYNEYLGLLANTKFAVCPSAISTPDSFRIYEALEMGCVPVLDRAGAELFTYIWGKNPLVNIVDWQNLNIRNMPNFYTRQGECKYWWGQLKNKIVTDLLDHASQLQ